MNRIPFGIKYHPTGTASIRSEGTLWHMDLQFLDCWTTSHLTRRVHSEIIALEAGKRVVLMALAHSVCSALLCCWDPEIAVLPDFTRFPQIWWRTIRRILCITSPPACGLGSKRMAEMRVWWVSRSYVLYPPSFLELKTTKTCSSGLSVQIPDPVRA